MNVSNADERLRLDSHETRIENLETERGDHSRKLIEHSSKLAQLEKVTKTLGDGVTRANETANRALREVDEQRERNAMVERAHARMVDKLVEGTSRRFDEQDEHLGEQDAAIAGIRKDLAPMAESLKTLVQIEHDKAVIRANETKEAAKLTAKEEKLKRRLGIALAVIAVIAAAYGFVEWLKAAGKPAPMHIESKG